MYEASHWLYLNLADADVNSFVPAWAAYRGIIATPNVLLDETARGTHLGLTPHLVRLFRKGNAIALEKEFMLEQIRRTNFPQSISRLNCFYCWPDNATAKIAPQFWADQGRHFDKAYLIEIGVRSQRNPTIVDTRWIDKHVINSTTPIAQLGTDWIHEYWRGSHYPWNGDTDIPQHPLMECLVDGTALIYGTELRMEAYSLVKKIAPDSTGILEKGRLGVDLCTRFGGTEEWRLGQTVPVLMSNEQRTALCVKHIICLDERLAKHVNEKVITSGIKPDEINHSALEVFKRDTLHLPDLRPVDADASWLQKHPKLNLQVNQLLTALFLENGGNIEAAIKHQRKGVEQQQA